MLKNETKKMKPEVMNPSTGSAWVYSRIVKDHFFHPQNLLLTDPKQKQFNAHGLIGSPACGDVMRVWLTIDQASDRIKEFKWRTFGCASAIAATSMLSDMVTERGGMKVDKAMALKPQDITRRLGGLPNRKIHCSVLGDKALRMALNNWFKKTGQYERIVVEGTEIIDPITKVTEADIEEAAIEGVSTIKDLQKRTKVGIGNPECLPKAEQLLRFYNEKYFGKQSSE